MVHLNGAMELAPGLGLARLIVDLVQTGSTLKANGLHETEVIAHVTSRLIVNRTALKTRPDAVGACIARFRAALPPIYITESGCSYNTGPDENGVVDDQARIDYLRSHVNAVSEAITRGVDVRGYYCWSLMDNFEWAEGYTQRFGLVHVDYETQRRTPKRSAHAYAEAIREHRAAHA